MWRRHGLARTPRPCFSGGVPQPCGRRLPRGRCRGDGDGFRRRADRPRRRTGGHGRPAPRRRRALARRVPLRATAPVIDLLRRRFDVCLPAVGSRPRGRRLACTSGPTVDEICAYYEQVLGRADGRSGRVEFFPGCEFAGGRAFVSRVSGQRFEVPERCRVVDARLPRARHPGGTPPTFEVADGARVIPVNDLSRRGRNDQPVRDRGLRQDRDRQPASGCWASASTRRDLLGAAARPVDVQPGVDSARPGDYQGMAADMMRLAAEARSLLDDLFGQLEDAGHHAADRPVGHADDGQGADFGALGARSAAERHARRPARPHPGGPTRPTRPRRGIDCARRRTRWSCTAPPTVCSTRRWYRSGRPQSITLQPIRAGVPCLGPLWPATSRRPAMDDAEKNRLCPPSSYGDSLTEWARMNVRGARNSASFSAEPDIKQWTDRIAVNPARIPPEYLVLPRWTTPSAGWAATLAPAWRA